ncbi:hypothetical protein Tco_0818417 [Tanacetum coccineum]
MGKASVEKKKRKKKNKGSQTQPKVLRSRTITGNGDEDAGETSEDSIHDTSEEAKGVEHALDEQSFNNRLDDDKVSIQTTDDENELHSPKAGLSRSFASMWNETQIVEDTILAHKDKGKSTRESPFSVEKNTHVEYYNGGVFVKKTTYTEPMNVNFRALEHNTKLDEGIDVELSLDAVMEANERYSNTLYGYFIGKRVVFPIVEDYALNVWKKFVLQRTMMNAKGFYFFKFASHQGVMDVIENGPVWVKLRDVPLVGFNQDGLSAIATKVGKPIMLDSYTSTMCMESWGRPSYARDMVEISAINELKESITVATPSLVGGEKTVDTVTIEYEWRPHRCAHCKIFGYVDSNCPKQVQIAEKNTTTTRVDNEGFQQVTKKFNRGLVIGSHRNLDAKQSEGILVGKSKQRWYYRAKTTNMREDVGTSKIDENIEHVKPQSNNKEQIEDVDANMDETALFMTGEKVTVGASTPSHKFFVSFVYADNDYIQRRLLWKDLNTHKRFVGVHPWVIMGDFNASLCLEDSSTGSSRITISMREFKECMDSIEVIDVNQTGMRFTWNQKPNAESGFLIIARRSLRFPTVLKIHQKEKMKPKPFKFSNYIVHKDEFKAVVEEGWANTILGHKMF